METAIADLGLACPPRQLPPQLKGQARRALSGCGTLWGRRTPLEGDRSRRHPVPPSLRRKAVVSPGLRYLHECCPSVCGLYSCCWHTAEQRALLFPASFNPPRLLEQVGIPVEAVRAHLGQAWDMRRSASSTESSMPFSSATATMSSAWARSRALPKMESRCRILLAELDSWQGKKAIALHGIWSGSVFHLESEDSLAALAVKTKGCGSLLHLLARRGHMCGGRVACPDSGDP